MNRIDTQLRKWKKELIDLVKINEKDSYSLASNIAIEIASLSQIDKNKLNQDQLIPLKYRVEELYAFQMMMDSINKVEEREPCLIRSQVIIQSYICFVYLKDNLLKSLKKIMPSDSLTYKCCDFLKSEDIRHFRNAFSHGNWRYDFSSTELVIIEFWDMDKNHNFIQYKVTEKTLGFWQTFSRAFYYSILLTLSKEE